MGKKAFPAHADVATTFGRGQSQQAQAGTLRWEEKHFRRSALADDEFRDGAPHAEKLQHHAVVCRDSTKELMPQLEAFGHEAETIVGELAAALAASPKHSGPAANHVVSALEDAVG